MTIRIQSESELPLVARKLLSAFPGRRIFAFYGAMGAGKTTLIKALCRELGVADNALSPTFAIINEYHTREEIPVYHMDFYRIDRLEEVYDIGYEEYVYSGRYCFIEWPELMEDLLPAETVKVRMEVATDRIITF